MNYSDKSIELLLKAIENCPARVKEKYPNEIEAFRQSLLFKDEEAIKQTARVFAEAIENDRRSN